MYSINGNKLAQNIFFILKNIVIPSPIIKMLATKAGFDDAVVTTADQLETDGKHLDDWIRQGHAGEMVYMTRTPHRRADPMKILPSAKSVIVLAINYFNDGESALEINKQSGNFVTGEVSRYAWGKDYHLIFEEKLRVFERLLQKKWGNKTQTRWYVDYGPVLEKALAQRAGLGFIGKNTLLITKNFGSWVFLSVVLTDLEIEPHQPELNQCGSCSLCIDHCPTGALVGPFQLDARRCISYLTIENKGTIDEKFHGSIGNWVFGCDICQDVCPYNAHPVPTAEKDFNPTAGTGRFLPLNQLGEINTENEFKMEFYETPLLRPKLKGILRNATVVLKNKNDPEARALVEKLKKKNLMK